MFSFIEYNSPCCSHNIFFYLLEGYTCYLYKCQFNTCHKDIFFILNKYILNYIYYKNIFILSDFCVVFLCCESLFYLDSRLFK